LFNRRGIRVIVPGLITAAFLWGSSPAAHAASGSGAPHDPESISTTIEHADTQTKETAVKPSGGVDASKGVTVTSDGVVVTVPARASGQLNVTSRYGGKRFSLGLPAAANATAAIATSGAVTYDDAAHGVALGVRTFNSGVQIATVIATPQADHTFTYPLSLPAGGHIEALEGGGLVFLSADGKLLGGFAAPWAKDVNGSPVTTSYQIQGNKVIQHVQVSAAAAYPVVADPYLWIDLISSAAWTYNSGYGWTLKVSPTGWARANAGSYLVGTYDWNELYDKYKNRGLNTNLSGMRDQLICHQQIVAVVSPTKATWNLDEWRPNVGYLQTVNASCNPGGTKWFD
jgi:hypothetical protein